MRGREEALCLSSSRQDSHEFCQIERTQPHQDRRKAPSSTQPLPLSLQMGDELLGL